MEIFYHHVGSPGADRDFPKTVFGEVTLKLVEENIGDGVGRLVVQELEAEFGTDAFNCWGVPAGAHQVIQSLKPGDVMLLAASARIDGLVPALCEVRVFEPAQFRELSNILWGDEKYPYLFFFKTERLTLTWPDFLEHLGYSENFNPRGWVYHVSASRLAQYHGPEGYVNLLRTKYLAPA